MRSNTENMEQFIRDHECLHMPIMLDIGLHKLADRNHPKGNQKRYLKCYVGDFDITKFVAETTNLPFSEAKDSPGCVIIHGCGMDMGLALINRINAHLGCKAFSEDYNYLGKWSKGKYCA